MATLPTNVTTVHTRARTLAPWVAASLIAAGDALGQDAYFSLEGDFNAVGDQHDFFFNLSRSVDSRETLRFQTFAHQGGTNAAGDAIAAGGIDSILALHDSGDNPHGINDDFDTVNHGRDSLLSWPGFAPNPGGNDTPLNPDPLPAASYRLELAAFAGDTGPWAVDLVGPANALTFTGAAAVGSSTIDTLKFGTTGGGTDAAAFNLVSGTLALQGNLIVANTGHAAMTLSAGARMSNTNGAIGYDARSTGTVTVTGPESLWTNTGALIVGNAGIATLNILSGGQVTVGGTTAIGAHGAVNLNGGTFDFGQTTLDTFRRFNYVSGALVGDVTSNEVVTASGLPSFPSAVDFSRAHLVNSGTILGSTTFSPIALNLRNTAAGEVNALTGERVFFQGPNNINDGRINLAGGEVRFTQKLTNNAGGVVTGNGALRADGGTTNNGTMAFSATANVFGDVTNNASGLIVSAGGTTTFFDDVTNSGEIRTAVNSFTVYFGSLSGNGDTGPGTVIIESDLTPGFSPGLAAFGGDLQFGDAASLQIELAGLSPGAEHDRITVAGDADLKGLLDVALLGGFTLDLNQQFDIIDVEGARAGTFDGLNEGGLVGNFGGTDLFITYAAGDGNDVALFTIPEPATLVLLGLGIMAAWPRTGAQAHEG